MPIDAYQYCPCGRGKKIKFCCKDVAHQVERILRMLEGEQPRAALAQLDRELEKHPGRDVFLAMKAEILWQTQEIEAFCDFAEQFERLAPDNPVALASVAIMHAVQPQEEAKGQIEMEPHTRSAVQKLQQALKRGGSALSPLAFEALGVVSRRLKADHRTLAARAHLVMYAALINDASHPAVADLIQENRSYRVPLLFKQPSDLPEPPDAAPWKSDYEAVIRLDVRGAWQAALDELKELSRRFLGEPILHRAIAMLRCRLGDDEAAARALRRYGALDGIDPEDAIECEALAQLIDPHTYKTMVDLVETTYEIGDAEAVSERLLSDRRVVSKPEQLAHFTTEDSPPPKGYYLLLDRPQVDSGKELEGSDIPLLLGQFMLYGKETDRKARLVITAHRDAHYDELLKVVTTLAGEELHDGEETVLGSTAENIRNLQPDWYLPSDMAIEDHERFLAWRDDDFLIRRWPDTRLDVLDGQTPRQVAADPQWQRKVSAALLALESTTQNPLGNFDYDRLRQELDLPIPTAPIPEPGGMDAVRLAHLHRVDFSALSDDDLISAHQQASFFGVLLALRKILPELLSRESLASNKQVNRLILMVQQSQVATTLGESQSLLHAAQMEAKQTGQSPARLLVAELSLLLSRGKIEGVQELVQTIQDKYLREPGIHDLMVQTLSQFGLLGDPAGEAAPGAGPTSEAAEDPSSGLWTPDQTSPETPTPPAEGTEPEESGPSKLWVPGMD